MVTLSGVLQAVPNPPGLVFAAEEGCCLWLFHMRSHQKSLKIHTDQKDPEWEEVRLDCCQLPPVKKNHLNLYFKKFNPNLYFRHIYTIILTWVFLETE